MSVDRNNYVMSINYNEGLIFGSIWRTGSQNNSRCFSHTFMPSLLEHFFPNSKRIEKKLLKMRKICERHIDVLSDNEINPDPCNNKWFLKEQSND